MPTVFIENDCGRAGLPSVMGDQREAARLAASLLAGRGCRRVGLISGPTSGGVVRAPDAALDVMRKTLGAAAPVPGKTHLVRERRFEERHDAMRDLLQSPCPPDGVCALSPDLSLGALQAWQEAAARGQSLPEVVSVVGPREDLRRMLPWSLVETCPTESIGREAVRMVKRLLASETLEEPVRRFPPTLLERPRRS